MPNRFNMPLTVPGLALAAAAALLFSPTTQADELVTNGGFETGDFTAWNPTPTPDPNIFDVDGNGPHNGSYSAFFGDINSSYDTISQSLTTVAGSKYTVSFYLDSSSTQGTDPASFIGTFGTTTFINLSNASPDVDFKSYSFQLTATSTSTLLSFKAYNTPFFYTLDDVSVQAIPAVPEAGTSATLMLGLAGIGAVARRHRKA